MANDSKRIVDKAWNFAHVLRDDGLSYMAYTEQITLLLFIKMAHEYSTLYPDRKVLIPEQYGWKTLLKEEGKHLERQYRLILEELGDKPGMLGQIFKRAKAEIQNPMLLRRLIVDLIEPENWLSMQADVKGEIYEGLLARSAVESPKGAGQYFTPRALIKAMVDCIQPTPDDTVCDPAAGTGGFLVAAHQYVLDHCGSELDHNQKQHLQTGFVRGWELVPNTARLCLMNLYLHGIDANSSPIESGIDALAGHPGEYFSIVMTNPPFGKKSSILVGNGEGKTEREDLTYERDDFFAVTKNKQLNFIQHVKTLLTTNGRCAIIVPDNVLFEGGAGETVRRKLLQKCNVHTLLRLPTGIFYAQGVKANVLFFDNQPEQEKPWTQKLWVYDLRTNMHFTLKTKSLNRSDLDDFVRCYHPGNRHLRRATWSEKTADGRWRAFDYEELIKRDKANLDIFWLKDKSLEGREELLDPAILAQEIADDLQAAVELFGAVASELAS
jgi:type I restriction enzyme M protein